MVDQQDLLTSATSTYVARSHGPFTTLIGMHDMDEVSAAVVQAKEFVNRSPFNRWLGMSVLAAGDDGIVLGVTWREEFISSPERQSTHGGILAALVDAAGDYAVALKVGRPVPTIDMRVDYHRVATPGDLRAEGRVIHLGKSMATAEARVLDLSGKLIASGRALYLVSPPLEKPTGFTKAHSE